MKALIKKMNCLYHIQTLDLCQRCPLNEHVSLNILFISIAVWFASVRFWLGSWATVRRNNR
jgi:hypothetical protein